MPKVARVGDVTMGSCSVHGNNISGVIMTGSSNVTADGIPVSKIGDSVQATCGHVSTITSGSSIATVNGLPVARVGDSVGGSPYVAVIISGSPTVESD